MKAFIVMIVLTILSFSMASCESQSSSSAKSNALVQYFSRPGSFFSYRYMKLLYQETTITPLMVVPKENTAVEVSSFSKQTKRLIDYPTFMDATGFFTTIKNSLDQVAILDSSYVELWQLAGGRVTISTSDAMDRNLLSLDQMEYIKKKENGALDYEQLLSLAPDLVILEANNSDHLKVAELLRVYDIPVLVLKISSYSDYLSVLSMFTKILETPKQYEMYGSKSLDQIEKIKEQILRSNRKPTVLLQQSQSRTSKLEDHIVYHILEDLGIRPKIQTKNVEASSYSSSAYDFILHIDGNNQVSLQSTASNSILHLPKDLFSYQPNQRWPEAYQFLVDHLF